MQKKKVLIAAGGTGGHIYPALALSKQLSLHSEFEVAFVGGNLAQNRYFDSSSLVHSISCGSFTSKNPFKLGLALGKIAKGLWQSHRLISTYRPDVAVGFGSYYTFPALLAALLNNVPVILHEANSVPGKVNRLLSRYVEVTGIHFPATAVQMKGKTALVGMPLRPGFKKGSVAVAEARAYFGLEDKPTLLIFGGSQGAEAINRTVMGLNLNFQFIHLTGPTKKVHYNGQKTCVKEFETRMDLAWAAADCAICRAGAGTISEAIEYEVPLLLIPFPRAADNHQELNADFMVDTVGGAEKLLERDLGLLPQKVEHWLSRLPELRQNIARYKQHKHETDLFSLIQEVIQ